MSFRISDEEFSGAFDTGQCYANSFLLVGLGVESKN